MYTFLHLQTYLLLHISHNYNNKLPAIRSLPVPLTPLPSGLSVYTDGLVCLHHRILLFPSVHIPHSFNNTLLAFHRLLHSRDALYLHAVPYKNVLPDCQIQKSLYLAFYSWNSSCNMLLSSYTLHCFLMLLLLSDHSHMYV